MLNNIFFNQNSHKQRQCINLKTLQISEKFIEGFEKQRFLNLGHKKYTNNKMRIF